MADQHPEPWLRGPIPGIHPSLLPIAHSLTHTIEALPEIVAGLTHEQLWAKPGGAASLGFHLKHLPSSLDRLYTYARGEKLSQDQFVALREEQETDNRTADTLLADAILALQKVIGQLRETNADTLHEVRYVGRAALPSNQLALLYHGAEHCQRHVGAMIATAKFIRSLA